MTERQKNIGRAKRSLHRVHPCDGGRYRQALKEIGELIPANWSVRRFVRNHYHQDANEFFVSNGDES